MTVRNWKLLLPAGLLFFYLPNVEIQSRKIGNYIGIT